MLKQLNKKGGVGDIFVFVIFTFIFVLLFGIFIFIGGTAYTKVYTVLQNDTSIPNVNMTEVVNNSLGQVNTAYQSLYWISVMLIVGMIIGLFISSILVRTHPVFLIPYFIMVIIAVVVSVVIELAYEKIVTDETLGAIYSNFVGANFFISHLPIVTALVGIVGAGILFFRLGSGGNY